MSMSMSNVDLRSAVTLVSLVLREMMSLQSRAVWHGFKKPRFFRFL